MDDTWAFLIMLLVFFLSGFAVGYSAPPLTEVEQVNITCLTGIQAIVDNGVCTCMAVP